jgi:hypothetical protein
MRETGVMTNIRRLLSSVYRHSMFNGLLLFIAVVMVYPINFRVTSFVATH